MIIGSSHGVGGKVETEVLSVVCAQMEPIHADCMEEVNQNIDTLTASPTSLPAAKQPVKK